MFSNSSITELIMVWEGRTREEDEEEEADSTAVNISLFASLAHQLRVINFDYIFPSDIPTFAKCSNLKELTLRCSIDHMKTIIHTLPSQLSVLRVEVLYNEPYAENIALFNSFVDLPSLRRLRCFQFLSAVCTKKLVTVTKGGPVLIEVLEGRGVKIIYGDGVNSFDLL